VLLEFSFEVKVPLKVYIVLSRYNSNSRLESVYSNYRVDYRNLKYITDQI
jgi:hypothetical protein